MWVNQSAEEDEMNGIFSGGFVKIQKYASKNYSGRETVWNRSLNSFDFLL